MIWSLNGPPKLRHFLWRACKNTLPVNEVRYRRHMADSPLCSRCNVADGTVCHALMDCQQSNLMWLTHLHANTVAAAPRASFKACLAWFMEHCDNDALVIICASLWACWFGRTKIIFENKTFYFVQLSTSYVKMIHDYSQYASEVSHVHVLSVSVPRSWRPPDDGQIKANFDVYVGPDCIRGLGAVFRNHDGKILVAVVKRMKSNMGVKAAELAAACFALEIAQRMEYDHIVLEGDAQTVINSIKECGRTPIFALYESLHVPSSSFTSFSCTSVRRNENIVAHTVVRWDTSIAHEKICMELFPSSLRALADLDLI